MQLQTDLILPLYDRLHTGLRDRLYRIKDLHFIKPVWVHPRASAQSGDSPAEIKTDNHIVSGFLSLRTGV